MKILKICSLNYNSVIGSFYRRYPELKDMDYASHKTELCRFCPVHLNGFSRHMRELGHECDEVVCDLETLQKSWMVENGYPIPEDGWRLEILMKQIETFRPEILYLQDIAALPPAWRRRLKKYYPFLKGIVVYRGFPVVQEGLEDIDLILSGARNLISTYEGRGMTVRYLPHAFEANALREIDAWDYRYPFVDSEFSFLGYSGFGGYGEHHKERYRFLERLMEQTSLKCWLADYGQANAHPETFCHREKDRCFEGLMGLEVYQALRRSKVVFNRHSTAHPGQVENMRLFEATGVGACLLTDDGDNLPLLFERDAEVVTYRSFDECLEKLTYLLANEPQRNAIALAGQKRTLTDHTWQRRSETISGYLREVFS